MKTRSPYTELLYTLSPSTNVTESLTTFGITEGTTSAIAVRFSEEGDICSLAEDLKTILDCAVYDFSLDNLVRECDMAAVKLVYKPTSDRVIGEICSAIATKNI